MTKQFEVPIVLMTFLRTDAALKIIARIREVQPKKIYILSDGPRNEKERIIINDLREKVIKAIDWNAEIIKNFPDENRGVYQNIGMGAEWVFSKEDRAIFLEDDNLPDVSFFSYCEELLNKYESDERIFWICGTNYLKEYKTADGSDYMFTRHLLPCGWASWAKKFVKYYDKELVLPTIRENRKRVRKTYIKKSLYTQQIRSIRNELYRKEHGMRFISWDFHTIFSIRANGLFGISPRNNLIDNIGVDDMSTHVKPSTNNPNVFKFCNIETVPLTSPLKHPKVVDIDKKYEKATAKIILAPFFIRFMGPMTTLIKKMFHVYPNGSLSSIFKKKKRS
jgi:hypothetical protein